jgi:DNA-binding FadR family transcriptional regulator
MGSLLDEIVAGERPAGDILPRELDLAEQFEISRGVARESIRALEERGLISVRHGRGATVNERSTWDLFDPDVLSAVIAADGGVDVLRDHVECRRMLEVEAAALASERASDDDGGAIRHALGVMEEAAVLPVNPANERHFHEADLAFHQAIMAATGNRALGILTERVHSALLVARQPTARPAYRLSRAIPEHRVILEAIEARDSEGARTAMHAHLDTVLGYLSEGLSERP